MPKPTIPATIAANSPATSGWANSVRDAIDDVVADIYGATQLEIPWASITGLPATFAPTTSATVVSETAYGLAATAGAGATASRGDHAHGTPALGSTVVSETAYGQAAAAGAGATASKVDHTHGTPALPTAAAIGAPLAYDTPATADGGKRVYVGTTAPTGASDGDIWIKG